MILFCHLPFTDYCVVLWNEFHLTAHKVNCKLSYYLPHGSPFFRYQHAADLSRWFTTVHEALKAAAPFFNFMWNLEKGGARLITELCSIQLQNISSESYANMHSPIVLDIKQKIQWWNNAFLKLTIHILWILQTNCHFSRTGAR